METPSSSAESRMVGGTVVDRLDRMVDTFTGLFRGDNLGKMLVRLPA